MYKFIFYDCFLAYFVVGVAFSNLFAKNLFLVKYYYSTFFRFVMHGFSGYGCSSIQKILKFRSLILRFDCRTYNLLSRKIIDNTLIFIFNLEFLSSVQRKS